MSDKEIGKAVAHYLLQLKGEKNSDKRALLVIQFINEFDQLFNKSLVELLRDCWSEGMASGMRHPYNLEAIQKDFNAFLKEKNIPFKNLE